MQPRAQACPLPRANRMEDVDGRVLDNHVRTSANPCLPLNKPQLSQWHVSRRKTVVHSASPLGERFYDRRLSRIIQMNLLTNTRASQRCNPVNALAITRRRGGGSERDSSAGAGGEDGSLLEKRFGYGVIVGLMVASAASTALILARPNWWVFHSPICLSCGQ